MCFLSGFAALRAGRSCRPVRGGCSFVLSACQFLERSDCPNDYQVDGAGSDVLMRGGSCIVAPSGELLAGPDYDAKTILFADLDLADVIRGKYDLDVVGHYARPDVLRLEVDERPKQSVFPRDS